jgi:hypothetical protein
MSTPVDKLLSDEQSVIGALLQTIIQVFWAFGVCITSLVVQSRYDGTSTSTLLSGLRAAFWLTAGISWACEFGSAPPDQPPH